MTYEAKAKLGSRSEKPWVAEITGTDEKFNYARTFLKSGKVVRVNGYSFSYMGHEFEVKEGKIYEANTYASVYGMAREFFTVRDGEIIILTQDEVDALLAAPVVTPETATPELNDASLNNGLGTWMSTGAYYERSFYEED